MLKLAIFSRLKCVTRESIQKSTIHQYREALRAASNTLRQTIPEMLPPKPSTAELVSGQLPKFL